MLEPQRTVLFMTLVPRYIFRAPQPQLKVESHMYISKLRKEMELKKKGDGESQVMGNTAASGQEVKDIRDRYDFDQYALKRFSGRSWM